MTAAAPSAGSPPGFLSVGHSSLRHPAKANPTAHVTISEQNWKCIQSTTCLTHISCDM